MPATACPRVSATADAAELIGVDEDSGAIVSGGGPQGDAMRAELTDVVVRRHGNGLQPAAIPRQRHDQHAVDPLDDGRDPTGDRDRQAGRRFVGRGRGLDDQAIGPAEFHVLGGRRQLREGAELTPARRHHIDADREGQRADLRLVAVDAEDQIIERDRRGPGTPRWRRSPPR